MKRGNKKYGKDEVFKLLRDFVDSVTKENFYKSLELLTQNQSVKLNVIGKPECLLLPKENQKIERKWWKRIKTDFNRRYWKPQIKNLGRIQEYEKFVFDRS